MQSANQGAGPGSGQKPCLNALKISVLNSQLRKKEKTPKDLHKEDLVAFASTKSASDFVHGVHLLALRYREMHMKGMTYKAPQIALYHHLKQLLFNQRGIKNCYPIEDSQYRYHDDISVFAEALKKFQQRCAPEAKEHFDTALSMMLKEIPDHKAASAINEILHPEVTLIDPITYIIQNILAIELNQVEKDDFEDLHKEDLKTYIAAKPDIKENCERFCDATEVMVKKFQAQHADEAKSIPNLNAFIATVRAKKQTAKEEMKSTHYVSLLRELDSAIDQMKNAKLKTNFTALAQVTTVAKIFVRAKEATTKRGSMPATLQPLVSPSEAARLRANSSIMFPSYPKDAVEPHSPPPPPPPVEVIESYAADNTDDPRLYEELFDVDAAEPKKDSKSVLAAWI